MKGERLLNKAEQWFTEYIRQAAKVTAVEESNK